MVLEFWGTCVVCKAVFSCGQSIFQSIKWLPSKFGLTVSAWTINIFVQNEKRRQDWKWSYSRSKGFMSLKESNLPVHFYPFHCWSTWLFRRRQPVFSVGRRWRANLDGCKVGGAVVGRPFRLPAMMIGGRRIGTFCCHMAQYLAGPNTFDPVAGWGNCIAQWETFACPEKLHPCQSQQ